MCMGSLLQIGGQFFAICESVWRYCCFARLQIELVFTPEFKASNAIQNIAIHFPWIALWPRGSGPSGINPLQMRGPTMKALSFPLVRHMAAAALVGAALAGCATAPAPESSQRELVVALTASHELIPFHAGQPDRILERRPVTGLPAGERLVGIDFRVARGVLYALSQAGRLYTLDIPTGALRPVGPAPEALGLRGTAFGFDFNPAADRVRVVSPNTGQLRPVGSLGLPRLTDVAFDISDVGNTALIAVRTSVDSQTRLHLVDLRTGATRPVGTVGEGAPLLGMAIEP